MMESIPVDTMSVFPFVSMLVACITLSRSVVNFEKIFESVSLSILLTRLLIKSSLGSFLIGTVLVGGSVLLSDDICAWGFDMAELSVITACVAGFTGAFAVVLCGEAALA